MLDAPAVHLVMFVILVSQDIPLLIANVFSVAQLEHSMQETSASNAQISVIIAQVP